MNNHAMAQTVQAVVKPKFRGHKVLKSKVVTHFPDNLAREYERITNVYMTLFNKTLAAHLPTIRLAIDAEREGMRHDDDNGVMSITSMTFMRIQREFEKKAGVFDLERRLKKLANLTEKLSVREWKRVVHNTLGIKILEDYYKGEFNRNALLRWTQANTNLIKTIPQDTLSRMRGIVQDGYLAGKSNTAIGIEIQEAYGTERRHARFIARDQIAKLNADITMQQHTDAGISEYIWSSSNDERVRKRHQELDGTQQKWSDPPIVEERTGRVGHPGQDYSCRCCALPIFNLPELNLPWEETGTG